MTAWILVDLAALPKSQQDHFELMERDINYWFHMGDYSSMMINL